MSQWPCHNAPWLLQLGPGAQGSLCRWEALPEVTPLLRESAYLFSLSYTKKGRKRNFSHLLCCPLAYYYYCYRYRFIYRWKMLPFQKRITMTERESLTLRPRYCLQCSESVAGRPDGRGAAPGDQPGLRELYRAGNLTVLGEALLLPDLPAQLDFHVALSPQRSAHWHSVRSRRKLFLDVPRRVLDQNSRQSLTATLDYVEEKTDVDLVFVNFQSARSDRGDLLRAFGYLGFETVRPNHPALPPWDNVIFMVYPIEQDVQPAPE
ncbi:ornithine decarboxylase antizyme 3 [Alligator sinensis]|uniref:Ornithine decarboxylase antizyme 3 n=1 Tax=Alligator sinensis TaxID=38654 RepID=A0A1U7Q2H0_ALLSI|nr:ornithine decarboxylase antizyme 3 [Alligator sinensis]